MTREGETFAAFVMRVGEACYGAYAVHGLSARLPMLKRTVERIAKAAREGEDYSSALKACNDLPRLIDDKIEELQRLRAEAVQVLDDITFDRRGYD